METINLSNNLKSIGTTVASILGQVVCVSDKDTQTMISQLLVQISSAITDEDQLKTLSASTVLIQRCTQTENREEAAQMQRNTLRAT